MFRCWRAPTFEVRLETPQSERKRVNREVNAPIQRRTDRRKRENFPTENKADGSNNKRPNPKANRPIQHETFQPRGGTAVRKEALRSMRVKRCRTQRWKCASSPESVRKSQNSPSLSVWVFFGHMFPSPLRFVEIYVSCEKIRAALLAEFASMFPPWCRDPFRPTCAIGLLRMARTWLRIRRRVRRPDRRLW
jgi:hypothetical protein